MNHFRNNAISLATSPNTLDEHHDMVLILAGAFRIGSEEGSPAEGPLREVYVDAFWMDETPVTNEQFASFVQETGYRTEIELRGAAWGYEEGVFGMIAGLSWRSYALPKRLDHPVVLVTWNDATAFANWAGKRLPTEAEWEKAARDSQVGALYPWGNEAPDGTQCPFARVPAALPPTAAVRSFPATTSGLYDMVGNVWQWCADWFGEEAYAAISAPNPNGPATGEHRVRRGGSWNVLQAFRLRCANRGAMAATETAANMGFRCAKSLIL